MDTALLATKLQIPPRPRQVVRREDLHQKLEHNMPHAPLSLLAAPAGYGKTTLLSQWAQVSRFRVVWLSLGEEENDLERFLRYLVTGWAQAEPGVMESKVGVLLGAARPDSAAILPAFINAANELADHLVLVLDDYHLMVDPSIHAALTFLLDHIPPMLHFVIASRAEPPLPLARYRAHDSLLELRAEELRFSLEETALFLNTMMDLNLSRDEIEFLQTQLEGWVAGLQLAALSLRRHRTGAELAISGKQRFIADYLSEDVFAHLPEQVQRFLLRTSILETLCGSLCDAVTGEDNSQAMLETLDRENLFLVSLDDNREWFRYHRLFADFLHEELKRRHPDIIPDLHRRAARWYLANDLPELAYRQAVSGHAAQIVVEIFDHYVSAKLNKGELRTVERWINGLPPAWYEAYPVLGLARVGFLAFTGAFEACIQHLDAVEQQLMSGESHQSEWPMVRVTAVRCLIACMQNDLTQAERYAHQALQALPDEDRGWRPGIYTALGDTYRQSGRWQEAQACYHQALAVSTSPQIRFMAAHVFGALADLALRQGHLRDANDYWIKALEVIREPESWGHVPLPVIGWVHIRLGEMLYQQNDLAQAWEHLSRGLERAELGGDLRALMAGYLIAARLKLTEGENDVAEEYLERARPLAARTQFSGWLSRFERCQLEVWLAQDKLRTAVIWAEETLENKALDGRPESETAQLAAARVLIVEGNRLSIERALGQLERLLRAAEEEGQQGTQVEAMALQALAHWTRGDLAQALIALERALRLAEPEGYVRLFADLGQPMGRLLQEAQSRAVLPDYVATLLAAFGSDFTVASGLPEPLTPREHEILELLAAGLTNHEIADRLVIASGTVKKHTGSIYGKLGVNNRTEAAARARELNLLS